MRKNEEQVFEKYCRLLYKISILMLCNEQDACDAVQETFLRYLVVRKEFHDEAHEKSWLTRVNINVCKNMLRYQKMHPTVPYETLTECSHMPEENEIMNALMSLKPKDKEVLILYYVEGYTCKEAAEILRITQSSIKKKLERARVRLRKKYEEDME